MANEGFGPDSYPLYLLLHSWVFIANLWGVGLESLSLLVYKAVGGLCATSVSLLAIWEDHIGYILNLASQLPNTHAHMSGLS